MTQPEYVGYDDSPDMWDLVTYCVPCGVRAGCVKGQLILRGAEWGGHEPPTCATCGVEIDVELVEP